MKSGIRRPAGPKRIQPLKQIAGIGKRVAPKRAITKIPAPKPVVKKVPVKSRLTHFEHAEDHLINGGFEGYTYAVTVLNAVHATMTGEPTAILTEKYDGSPSIVFGIFPVTGKFFVATKSFFNKVPKINYTHEDIVRNHGYSEELVAKLGKALEHLPKITPEQGIFQGDLMHIAGMNIEETEDQVRFNANTITYSISSRSEEGKRLLASQLSIAIHTEHTNGARYADHFPTLMTHPDVCVISVKVDLAKIYYPAEAQTAFKWHMDRAADLMHTIPTAYPEAEKIKKYINKKIKDRATNQGLQLGSGGQNLTGFKDDWESDLPPDPAPAKPTVASSPAFKKIELAAEDTVRWFAPLPPSKLRLHVPQHAQSALRAPPLHGPPRAAAVS